MISGGGVLVTRRNPIAAATGLSFRLRTIQRKVVADVLRKEMAITGIHHFNIRVSRIELVALERFYCEVIGLNPGPRPPFRSSGTWLYAVNTPLLHLTQMHSGEVVAPGSPQSLPEVQARYSAIDHIALASTDLDGALQRLTANGVAYTLTEVPAVGEIQVFCRDPSGNGIELIFPMGVVARGG